MKTTDPAQVVQEIAQTTDNDETLVSRMYADAVEEYQRGARILDYVPLFAAKRVRDELKVRSAKNDAQTASTTHRPRGTGQ
jgi:hypothetical protein